MTKISVQSVIETPMTPSMRASVQFCISAMICGSICVHE